ncbi:hypothetical protein BaRGS_00002623 [Batillaria attramentaria]|uniref:Uncharacterized protein n=1 Tax=Batillaria attramentaria TaxID=370345 RepID=A0ABD0M2D9_9CAEN
MNLSSAGAGRSPIHIGLNLTCLLPIMFNFLYLISATKGVHVKFIQFSKTQLCLLSSAIVGSVTVFVWMVGIQALTSSRTTVYPKNKQQQ